MTMLLSDPSDDKGHVPSCQMVADLTVLDSTDKGHVSAMRSEILDTPFTTFTVQFGTWVGMFGRIAGHIRGAALAQLFRCINLQLGIVPLDFRRSRIGRLNWRRQQ